MLAQSLISWREPHCQNNACAAGDVPKFVCGYALAHAKRCGTVTRRSKRPGTGTHAPAFVRRCGAEALTFLKVKQAQWGSRSAIPVPLTPIVSHDSPNRPIQALRAAGVVRRRGPWNRRWTDSFPISFCGWTPRGGSRCRRRFALCCRATAGADGLFCYPALDRPAVEAGGRSLMAEIEDADRHGFHRFRRSASNSRQRSTAPARYSRSMARAGSRSPIN